MGSSKTVSSLALSLLLLFQMGIPLQVRAVPYLHNEKPAEQHLQHRFKEHAEMHEQAEQEFLTAQKIDNLHMQVQLAQNSTVQTQQAQQLTNVQRYTKLAPDIIAAIAQQAKDKQIPLSIVLGLMEQESSFRTDAVNPQTGAIGLGQIEHPTAVDLAARGGFAIGDLHDPKFNAKIVIAYLDQLHHQTGDWNATLTAYNRGLGGLYAFQRQTGTSSSDYSRQVMQKAQHIREVTGVE